MNSTYNISCQHISADLMKKSWNHDPKTWQTWRTGGISWLFASLRSEQLLWCMLQGSCWAVLMPCSLCRLQVLSLHFQEVLWHFFDKIFTATFGELFNNFCVFWPSFANCAIAGRAWNKLDTHWNETRVYLKRHDRTSTWQLREQIQVRKFQPVAEQKRNEYD